MEEFLLIWSIISTILEGINHFFNLFSYINKGKDKLPVRLLSLLEILLLTLLLPFRILWYGVSYIFDLGLKKKCWIKIKCVSQNHFLWILLDDKFEELLSFNKKFETNFEALNNAKSNLGVKYHIQHKKENDSNFYCIYIRKSDYDGFYELKHEKSQVKISDPYIKLAFKGIIK